MKTKIFFHICCGPCATATISKLQAEGFEVVGYYYNPNIHPKPEYQKRLSEAKKLAKNLNFKLIVPEYNPSEYFEAIKGYEKDKNRRCPECWNLRLEKTAQEASKMNFKVFGTTLRISPYQDQQKLLEIGKRIALKYKLDFYEDDLVCLFSESVNKSKDLKMYRQKYCGCIFSKDCQ